MKKSSIIKIGIIITISIGIFIWGFNFLKGTNLFKPVNEYHAVYDKVDGLIVSSPVMVNGYQLGQVSDIHFDTDYSGELHVSFIIDDNFEVRKDAVAQIYSMDLMGTKAIKLIQGSSNKRLESGDTLMADIEGDLRDQVSMTVLPLKHKAEKLLSSFDSVLNVVTLVFNEKTQDNLSNSFANINSTIKNLEHTSFEIDTLITSERQKISSILTHLNSIVATVDDSDEDIRNVISNLSTLSDTLAQLQLKESFDKFDMALYDIQSVLNDINAGKGSLGKLVQNDTLYNNLEVGVYNMNKLIRDIYENPKRYIHFSAFDLGKTIYVEDGKEQKKKSGRRNKKNK